MTNQKVLFLLMFKIICSNVLVFSSNSPIKYLAYPEEYANFRLTRSYGTYRCNAVGLTNDIFNNHIASYLSAILAKTVATKFKHRLLNMRWKSIYQTESLFRDMPIGFECDWKAFEYHDGTYIGVPGIADYATWDGDTGRRWRGNVGSDKEAINVVRVLMHETHKPIVHVYSPIEECNKHVLYIYNMQNEKVLNSLCFPEKIASCVMSNDGNVFCVWQDNGHILQFFDTLTTKRKNNYYCMQPLMVVCSAHHLPLFAASSDSSVMLIDPAEKEPLWYLKKKEYSVRSIQFSPHDTYLCLHGDNSLIIYDIKSGKGIHTIDFDQTIQKISIAPDNDIIAIAFSHARLMLMKSLSHLESLRSFCQTSCWGYFDDNYNEDKPLILWNNNDNLLFTSNLSSCHTQEYFPISLGVRKATNGRFLMEHVLALKNPIAMGLTKNGQSIIFVHKDGGVSSLELYDYKGLDDIDFITREANWFQLCCLWHAYKISKESNCFNCFLYQKKAKLVVEKMRSLIAEYKKKES